MNDVGPTRGIVFAHGSVAQALVDAVRRITGCPEDALTPISNTEGAPDVLCERLKEMLAEGPTVVFADVGASSCANMARLSCKESAGDAAAVVVGVNLPMLLDFVFQRDTPLSALLPRLLERGRDGIQALPT